jgi:homospermidine synthase
MLLNLINFSYENVFRKFAGKAETKKALIFLEKKVNAMVHLVAPDEEEKEGLVVTKGVKCISCSKDFGPDYDGNRTERNKVWSGLPAKEPPLGTLTSKDKYPGFGNGFQTIIEGAVAKKGGDMTFDEKGRMTNPFNLAR